MGYTTEFEGKLTFAIALTNKELAHLSKMLGEDVRDHPEWQDHVFAEQGGYVQFELTSEFDGIQWDGSEKFYGATECVNLITREMKKINEDFRFNGELFAKGEDFDDRWVLKMVDGVATKQNIVLTGKVIVCPRCEEKFRLEAESE